jgi:membrane-associated phospholipid phosphatase
MSHRIKWSAVLGAAIALNACSDAATAPPDLTVRYSAVKFWEVGSSVGWNDVARQLIQTRALSPQAQGRMLAYLSVAQYNAIITAENTKDRGDHASPAAAAAGASLVVLKNFFPLDHALLEARLAAQRTAAPAPLEQKNNFAAGEAIGRSVGVLVNVYAATDNFNATTPPANPGGPGRWTGVNSIRGGYGARTWALTSGDQFRPPAPPAFGSNEFNSALSEIRALSDGLTSAQLSIGQFWAACGPGCTNGVATQMIVSHHRSEREAARILALANMAVSDVLNACFDAKFAYYLIRPSQVDPLIHLPVGLPNHPSYPSGHSCITGAIATVLASEFPDESDRLQAMVEEAGLARMYAGLHYRFDCLAGRELGRNVANYVMQVTSGGNSPIPLD